MSEPTRASDIFCAIRLLSNKMMPHALATCGGSLCGHLALNYYFFLFCKVKRPLGILRSMADGSTDLPIDVVTTNDRNKCPLDPG